MEKEFSVSDFFERMQQLIFDSHIHIFSDNTFLIKISTFRKC